MGADQDVNVALSCGRKDLFSPRIGLEAADYVNADRVGVHAVAKSFKMLFRQDSCGNENGDLTAIHDRNKGRPHGDLCLAVACIATDQSVHGLACGHVLFNFGNHPDLVDGLLIGEGSFEFMQPGWVNLVGDSL